MRHWRGNRWYVALAALLLAGGLACGDDGGAERGDDLGDPILPGGDGSDEPGPGEGPGEPGGPRGPVLGDFDRRKPGGREGDNLPPGGGVPRPPTTNPGKPWTEPDERNEVGCKRGQGRLVVKKDFCVASTCEEGYERCEVEWPGEAEIDIRKIQPKKRNVWRGTISETRAYDACVPAGTYVLQELCDRLPYGVSCLDPQPVEVRVQEGKKTVHTFVNLVEDAQEEERHVRIEKKFCRVDGHDPWSWGGFGAGADGLDAACHEVQTWVRVGWEIVSAYDPGHVVAHGDIGAGHPVLLSLPPGDYVLRERCEHLPRMFGCAEAVPFTVSGEGRTDLTLRNPVFFRRVEFRKEVFGCHYGEEGVEGSDCRRVVFAAEIEPWGFTPWVEWEENGYWVSNRTVVRFSEEEPGWVDLPFGSYVAREKRKEPFAPAWRGADVVRFEVPHHRYVKFQNRFEKWQCRDGLPNGWDEAQRWDCGNPVCLVSDRWYCDRSACSSSAWMEIRKNCRQDDPACIDAEVYLSVEGIRTQFADTPNFGGSWVIPAGVRRIFVPAPCGTYRVKAAVSEGWRTPDREFILDVPGFFFPVRVRPDNAAPADGEEVAEN